MAEAEICYNSTPVYYSSNRGGTKLELKGFVYNKDRTVESKVYWRCEDRKCKSRIVMDGENLVKVSAHTTHGPCQFEAEVQKSMSRLKEAASASQEPPSRLINRELQTCFPAHMRGNFPQEDTARQRIQRQRRKVVPPLPKSLSEMNIPEEWQRTSTGDQFQLLDVTLEEGSRIIVFCTDSCLRYLCSSKIPYRDGTFNSSSAFLSTLYYTWYCNGPACTVDVLSIGNK